MNRIASLVLALAALSACGRPAGPAPAAAPPVASPPSPASAIAPSPKETFCLVAVVKHAGPAHSVWLAWQDGDGEWRHERMFALRPGSDVRNAAARAIPSISYWLLLCDPGGFEVDDFVRIGHVTGTEAEPMPVVYAAKDGKIVPIDEPLSGAPLPRLGRPKVR